jgi:predicted acyltransferase
MGSPPQGRLQSLDIFRGATIASMVLVNNPGSSPAYAQLEHAAWHGWTFTDTVFPFFLWIVGVALTLSTARRIERGESKAQLLRHTVKRAVIIFLLGFLLSPLPNIDWSTIRIPGVLQRIAVCYLIAGAVFLFTSIRGQIIWLAGVNILYWMLMTLYPTPGCGAGSLTVDCNFARYVDSLFLSGHMWRATKVWDPEGIISTLPAISSVLFGILTGHILRKVPLHGPRLKWLFGGGAALLAAAHLLSVWMPFNKNIWTTSYAVLMAGLAMVSFGAWYWIADVRGLGRWFRFFEIFGANAILMFVLSGALAKFAARSGLHKWWYTNVCLAVASPINASLLYALTNVLVLWLVAWVLWKRRLFVRF